ncbi:MAG: prepilin-type N-terminal cleavage/methylation domain-containing protein [bacterium]|nr:prepilin-type N-terminal cleavage/methylation domain-containing protein [bacterium]
MKPRASRQGAFTLVELLVVVSIIALLISILMPSLKCAREQAKLAVCGSNLHQLGLGLQYGFEEFKAYPRWDDGLTCAGGGHFGRIATWIDVLFAKKYIGNNKLGYCPKDALPDPINRLRGTSWGFKYPHALGGGGGADHSYGIAVPLASYGGKTADMDYEREKFGSNRVIASDGWWTWMHGFGARGLLSRQFDDPFWGSNTVGWRHGCNNKQPRANFLFKDGSVSALSMNLSDRYQDGSLRGLGTTHAFFWRQREHTDIHPFVSGYNDIDVNEVPFEGGPHAYPEGVYTWPDELDPNWYTLNHQWPIGFKKYKGWVRN